MFAKLPSIPDDEELQRSTPTIAPVPQGVQRPFWSVMIPTYNCADYLRRTLSSVLSQAPGPDEMQIEVIDDVSTKDDPHAVVQELGGGRVDFFRNPANQGATATFNTCIERARGHWVHILHGDDMILPGFYDAYGKTIRASPEAVMAFGQVVIVDEDDRWTFVYGPLPPVDGPIVKDFYRTQAVKQLGQFAGVVVRRDAYEAVGGFCSSFVHVADWNMWFRLAGHGPVVQVDRPYGLYREHKSSDTSKLMVKAINTTEYFKACEVHTRALEGRGVFNYDHAWRREIAETAERSAWQLKARGSTEGHWNQIRVAYLMEPDTRRLRCVAKAYLKYKLKKS